jgi:hypothetical protein
MDDLLAQLGLNLSSLDIHNSDVSNDLSFLSSLLSELVEVIVTFG